MLETFQSQKKTKWWSKLEQLVLYDKYEKIRENREFRRKELWKIVLSDDVFKNSWVLSLVRKARDFYLDIKNLENYNILYEFEENYNDYKEDIARRNVSGRTVNTFGTKGQLRNNLV